MRKGMTKTEREILRGFKAALRYERGEKVRGFTRIVRRVPVTKSEVKMVRKMLHKTQEAFARSLGVSVRLVQAWEQGWRKPEPLPAKVIRAIETNPKFAEVLAAC